MLVQPPVGVPPRAWSTFHGQAIKSNTRNKTCRKTKLSPGSNSPPQDIKLPFVYPCCRLATLVIVVLLSSLSVLSLPPLPPLPRANDTRKKTKTGGPEVQQNGFRQHSGIASRPSGEHEHVLPAVLLPVDLDGHQHIPARVSMTTAIFFFFFLSVLLGCGTFSWHFPFFVAFFFLEM